jgi:pantothenate kinase-related protein Tda10
MAVISSLIGLAAMVFSLVIAWRVMTALELIAKSTSTIADKQK